MTAPVRSSPSRVPFGISATTRVYRVASTFPAPASNCARDTRSGANSCSGTSTKDRSYIRGCGTTISGSSLRSSPTSRTSTSRVRGPHRTSRTRFRAASARRARSQELEGDWRRSRVRSPCSSSRPGPRRRPARSRTPRRRGRRRSRPRPRRPRRGGRHDHRCSSPTTGTRGALGAMDGAAHADRGDVLHDRRADLAHGDRDRRDLLVQREDLVGDAVGQRLEQEVATLGRGADRETRGRRRSWSSR